MNTFAQSVIGVVLPVLLVLAASDALAIDSARAERFELTGSGTLTVDTPTLRLGDLQLKATLSTSAAVPAAPSIQSDARFTLTGTLAAASVVCYNDTIFRDDFDADGF